MDFNQLIINYIGNFSFWNGNKNIVFAITGGLQICLKPPLPTVSLPGRSTADCEPTRKVYCRPWANQEGLLWTMSLPGKSCRQPGRRMGQPSPGTPDWTCSRCSGRGPCTSWGCPCRRWAGRRLPSAMWWWNHTAHPAPVSEALMSAWESEIVLSYALLMTNYFSSTFIIFFPYI